MSAQPPHAPADGAKVAKTTTEASAIPDSPNAASDQSRNTSESSPSTIPRRRRNDRWNRLAPSPASHQRHASAIEADSHQPPGPAQGATVAANPRPDRPTARWTHPLDGSNRSISKQNAARAHQSHGKDAQSSPLEWTITPNRIATARKPRATATLASGTWRRRSGRPSRPNTLGP